MRIRAFATVLAIFCFALRAEECITPSSFKQVELDQDNFLISVLRLNGRPLWDGLDLYLVDDHVLVPASLFVDAMALDWNVDVGETSITPLGDSSYCNFSINFAKSPQSSAATDIAWAVDDFDLYFDIALLPLLLPIDYDLNTSLLHLNLFSEDIDHIESEDASAVVPTFYAKEEVFADRVIDDEYQWYTSPLVSYRLTVSDTREQPERTNLNLNSGFDLFQHETNFRVSRTNDNSLHFLRLKRTLNSLTNQYTDRGLTYEFGDIQLQGDNLVTTPNQSLGFLFHNEERRGNRNFTKTTIEEFVLPGWRVQLFRNGQFIDEKFSDDTNRVLFEDVDTFFGSNLFEIKLYGPEGQQETRTQSISIGDDQVQRGQVDYFFGINDNNHRLLDGKVGNGAINKSAIAKIGYGLTDATTISTSIQRLWFDDSPTNYVSASLDTQLSGSALNLSLTNQSDGGHAAFLGWSGRISEAFAFNVTSRYLNDFISQRYTELNSLKSDTSVRINGQSEYFDRFGWNVNLSHRTFDEREAQTSVGANINDNILGGTFSAGINAVSNSDNSLQGRLYYSKSLSGWQVASSWTFEPSNNFDTDSFYVALRWPYRLGEHRETRLQYRANGSNNIELQHQHNWGFDSFNIGAGASIAEGGDWTINLTLTGNINFNPYSQTFNFDRTASAAAGRIDAFAFFDSNRNNQYDDEEEKLAGIHFSGNSAWKKEATNNEGMARLLTSRDLQSLSVSPASLPDPFMVAQDSLVDVYTHSGGVNRVELPIHAINDVEGTVYLISDDSSRGAANLKLNIVNDTGEVVAEARTESDGYFYVTKLAPGDYRVVLDDTYLKRNSLTLENAEIAFNAPENGDVIFLDDIKLLTPSRTETTDTLVASNSVVNANTLYEVQVGIFRHARSIYEVLKHLPVSPSSIQHYRNHTLAMTYVTVGGFSSLSDANAFLTAIKQHPAFKESFVSPVSRYTGEQWTKESVYYSLEERIETSTQAIKKQKYVLCQLAAYQSLSSMNPQILALHPELLLVPDSKSSPSFHRLLAPLNEEGQCVDRYLDNQYRTVPFKVNSTSVLH